MEEYGKPEYRFGVIHSFYDCSVYSYFHTPNITDTVLDIAANGQELYCMYFPTPQHHRICTLN